jgi:hypothetical protein
MRRLLTSRCGVVGVMGGCIECRFGVSLWFGWLVQLLVVFYGIVSGEMHTSEQCRYGPSSPT